MLRAVLDTNVIVSGLIRPAGAPGQILERLLDEAFILVISPDLVDELRRSLRRPRVRRYILLSSDELEGRIAQLETLADPVEGKLELKVEVRDPDDIKFLVAAVEARANYVVTGDADLLTLGEHEGIQIVTPRAFWNCWTIEGTARPASSSVQTTLRSLASPEPGLPGSHVPTPPGNN